MPDVTTPASSEARALRSLQAMAEETRFDIVRRLAAGERCVCELQEEMDAAQSRLSFHLKKLRDAGVLRDRKVGRWVYYRLDPEALDAVAALLGTLGIQAREAPGAGWVPEGSTCC